MDLLEIVAGLWLIGQLVGLALAVLIIPIGIIYVVVQTLRGH
jgi:hypothetical protein